jgi:hypothetical protein
VDHVVGQVRGQFPGPAGLRFAATVSAVLALTATAGCTDGSNHHKSVPKAAASSATPSQRPASAPFRVSVTHVAGRLSEPRRAALARQVARTLSSYVDQAFLAGRYPRSDFADSFRSFTVGAAHRARSDQALLTNRPLGSSTLSVRAVHRTAYLSVLAPKQHPAGVTAAVDLTFVVDRGARPAQRVHLKGRLLLTRGHGGRWSIFGYSLSRSQLPVRSGS